MKVMKPKKQNLGKGKKYNVCSSLNVTLTYDVIHLNPHL